MLAGVAVFLIHRITWVVTGERRAAGWAVLFALASSAFWANGAISYYSMQAHLTANLLYAWLLLNPTSPGSLAAGLVGGLALLLHNPVPHMLFAAPWLITFALRPDTRRQLIPLVAGYLPATIAVGFERAWPRSATSTGCTGRGGDGRCPAQRIHSARCRHSQYESGRRCKDVRLGVAVLFLFLALPAYLRARDRLPLRLLTLSAVSTFAGYLLINLDEGHGWGYRYFQPAWGIIPILAACALIGRSDTEHGLVTFAGVSAILSLLILIPFQLMQIDHFITGHLAMLPPIKRPGGNVYFIDWRGGASSGHGPGGPVAALRGSLSRDPGRPSG